MPPLPPNAGQPAAPVAEQPPANWEHRKLYDAVTAALHALPSMFESDLVITGVLAPDLFTLNTSLGATLEVQVVQALNAVRRVWDPDQDYALYRWVRQSQTFPDVLLRRSGPGDGPEVLMGIELKGWYVLAKEKEPSFRYTVSPRVCQLQDLLVVVPWALSNVVSGSPVLFDPYIVEARYAAAYRNHHWEYLRQAAGATGITVSTVDTAYPVKSEQISDRAASDAGGNFGRFARAGLMDDYIAALNDEEIVGIPIWAWQRFLAMFSQDWQHENVVAALRRLEQLAQQRNEPLTAEQLAAAREKLVEIAEIVRGDD